MQTPKRQFAWGVPEEGLVQPDNQRMVETFQQLNLTQRQFQTLQRDRAMYKGQLIS